MTGARFAALLITGSVAVATVCCGSRTGLFGSERADWFPTESLAGTEDAGKDAAVPCIPGRFTFEVALSQLMFVLDRSGSMKLTLDGQSGDAIAPSEWRWSILQQALRTTIAPFDRQIAMGAKFFPDALLDGQGLNRPERACRTETDVGIAPALGNADLIASAFDVIEPGGGTPTSEALRVVADFLGTQRSVTRTIVLATDGGPNCNGDLDARSCVCTSPDDADCRTARGVYSCLDDARTIDTIRDIAEKKKIPVYVIGIGSTERPEFLDVLDAMAVAGGRPRATRPRHYNAQSREGLTNALSTIRDSIAKCTYLTPSAPTNPDKISVEINGVRIPRDQTKANGWDWVDKTFGWLAFFGDACAAAQGTTPPAVVSGVVTCDL